jgi:hypothetical protein
MGKKLDFRLGLVRLVFDYEKGGIHIIFVYRVSSLISGIYDMMV